MVVYHVKKNIADIAIRERPTLELNTYFAKQKNVGYNIYTDIKFNLCDIQNPTLFCEFCTIDRCKFALKSFIW